jgi:branched-chain amino acid transport system permease protein
MTPPFAALDGPLVAQFVIDGLSTGMLIALVALGYTMVYGIVELINFAHGDLFMLGAFLGWTLLGLLPPAAGPALSAAGVVGCLLVVPLLCAALNLAVDRVVYRPLRDAPKLAPFVSARGVSYIFMNAGVFWGGSQAVDFPALVPATNLIGGESAGAETPADGTADKTAGAKSPGSGAAEPSAPGWGRLRFTYKDLLVWGVTVPLMVGLTAFVRFTRLGKAMRAVAQNPTAARLMGIDTDRVIGATFVIGGALAGAGSVVYGLRNNTIHFQMGYTNGLFAFTAAVLGGIGNIPGAVLGGLLIGLVLSLGSGFVGEQWKGALVFATLIVVLVFRPAGLLGARVREKV